MSTIFHLPVLLMSCVLLWSVPGCGAPVESVYTTGGGSGNSSSDSADTFPLTLTDGLGRRVTLEAPPKRIVSLAPKNTELLFAIGAESLLAGTTTYCNYPEAAGSIAKVGGFTVDSISIETLIGLQPDLVLTVGELQRKLIDELERLGLAVIALPAESLDDLYSEIALLGRVTAREEPAEVLIESMQSKVASVRACVRDIPEHERVRVYFQGWDEPRLAAGPRSFLGELIELAAGKNIITETSNAYLRISEEVLLQRDPEVILTPSVASEAVVAEQLLQKPSWRNLSAVRNRRVYVLDGDLVSRCGPRSTAALEAIARLLYPDQFRSQADEPAPAGRDERRTGP